MSTFEVLVTTVPGRGSSGQDLSRQTHTGPFVVLDTMFVRRKQILETFRKVV